MSSRNRLIELEEKALALRNAGQLSEAADLFAEIVEQQPDWEHGAAIYSLAGCGGQASFLYLHGDSRAAFDAFLKLLTVESKNRHVDGIDRAEIALRTLGRKLGLDEEALSKEIAAARSC